MSFVRNKFRKFSFISLFLVFILFGLIFFDIEFGKSEHFFGIFNINVSPSVHELESIVVFKYNIVSGDWSKSDGGLVIKGGDQGFKLLAVAQNKFFENDCFVVLYLFGKVISKEFSSLEIYYNISSISKGSLVGSIKMSNILSQRLESGDMFKVFAPISYISRGYWNVTITVIGAPHFEMLLMSMNLYLISNSFEFKIGKIIVNGFWLLYSDYLMFFIHIKPGEGLYVERLFINASFPNEKMDYVDGVDIKILSRWSIPQNGFWIISDSITEYDYPAIGNLISLYPFTSAKFNILFKNFGFIPNKIYTEDRWLVFYVFVDYDIDFISNVGYYSPFFIAPWWFEVGFSISKIVDRGLYNYAGKTWNFLINVTIT